MQRSMAATLRISMLGSAAAAALCVSAQAQPQPNQTAPLSGRDAPAPTANQVGEVVVTAQKREQRLLDTPVPVTALTPQTLQRLNAVSFQDYLARVPGFADISGREGETQLILRGITTGQQPNSTVGTYVDDTPFGSSSVFANGGILTPDFDPSDLQRIEVLRGPQGTLYGANTLGGLLKFVTTPPDPTGYHARVEADGNTVDHGGDGYGVRGMVNIPIVSDKLALRANVFDRDDPGYIDNPTLGRHDINATRVYGGRVSLLWNANQDLSIRLTAASQNLKSTGTPDEDVDYTTLQPTEGKYTQNRSTNEVLDNQYRVYNGDVHWNLGFANLTSSTSYTTLKSYNSADATALLGGLGPAVGQPTNFGVNFPEPVHQTRLNEEVRLASNSGQRIDWQVGFYFDHERGGVTESLNPVNTLTGAILPIGALEVVTLQSRYTEYAGFADVTYHFTPQFDILAGVRYSSNDQHYTQGIGGALVGGAITYDPASKSSDSSTTFLVTPEYKIDANNLVYIRIASGYRPGGPNALPPAEATAGVPTSFQPDDLVSYEIGYKASLLDHRVTLDLSGFYINWNDVQLITTVQTSIGDFTAEGNGGSAVSKGIEGSLTFTPIHGLTLSDNFGYTDAFLITNSPGIGGVAGDRLPYVPRFSDNVNGDYDWTPVSGWDAYVGASYRFIGDRTSDFVATPPEGFSPPKIPSYEEVDLRGGVTYQNYTLNLYAKNLTDSRGVTLLTNPLATINPFRAALVQPRTFGFSVSAQF